MSSVTFSTAVGGDGSTVTDDNNATTGLRDGGWKMRFVPCFTQQVAVANYIVTKAGEASTSASNAAASAIDATNNGAAQVTLAAAQVSLATAQANAAAASYDSFDDRYLGSKTSDPSVDNDGNVLITGAIYWNSTSSVMKVWSGSAWVSYNPAISYLPLSGGTMTGAITFAAAQFGTNVNTFLSTPSSANLAAALTDETGTGVNVFNNTPTLITPILGTPTSGNLANCTNAISYKLKSATTDIAISSATAPTAGQVLTATSSTDATWQSAAVSGFTTMQVFTSSSTFTIPSGKTTLKITVVGGGGGGSVRTANGTNGNTSSVASGTQSITTISATGGAGSLGNDTGGIGGVGANGDINFYGSSGGPTPLDPTSGACGNGGSSYMGGGGAGRKGGSAGSGLNGNNYGGGGGGGNDGATGSGGGGGGGTAIKYLTSMTPGNTLTVTVGALAAGGTNGTQSGGSGAQGVVIIEY